MIMRFDKDEIIRRVLEKKLDQFMLTRLSFMTFYFEILDDYAAGKKHFQKHYSQLFLLAGV